MFGLRDSKLHVRSALGGKYLTAEICDEAGNLYFVMIKRKDMIHNHFFVRLGTAIYIFRVESDKIQTVRNWGTSPVSLIHYSTKHFLPVRMDELADIKQFRTNNPDIKSIDEVQAILLTAARVLEERAEANGGHADAISLAEAMKYVTGDIDLTKAGSVRQAATYQEALDRMGVSTVVTPLNLVTDFLGSTIQSSSLSIMSILKELERKEFQWKQIANPAKTPFQHWALIGLIAVAGLAIGGGLFVLGGEDLMGSQITMEDLVEAEARGDAPPGALESPAAPAPAPTDTPPPPAQPQAPAVEPTAAPAPAPAPADPLAIVQGMVSDPQAAFDQAAGISGMVIPGGASSGAAPPPPPAAETPEKIQDNQAAAGSVEHLEELAERMTARAEAEAEQSRRDAAANWTVDTRAYGAMTPAEWEASNKVWCAFHADKCIDELERLAMLEDSALDPADRLHGQPGEHGENCWERYTVEHPLTEDQDDKWAPCGLTMEEARVWEPRQWEALYAHPNFTRR